ncbi:hypothetical protein C1645_741985 [Glomus cerebriforme]|uniref:Uncharacterized protein n=1 Tax=Glomus cerebriforme TaxID=658196 RepID=A0A397SH70_9GLOM|nr:hypothetical protein C1645_741985 [Glomus cerebriforme]
MTYATRLSVRKSLQEKKEINNKSDGKKRSNQQQKRKVNPLPPQKPQYVKVYINGIIAIKIEGGEEYALLSYSDPNLVPDWQPMRNLRNSSALVEKFRNHLIQSEDENRNTLLSNSNQIIINEENCEQQSDCSDSLVTSPDTIFNASNSSRSSIAGDDVGKLN